MLGVLGIGAVIAFIGLMLYCLLVVAAVFFGPSLQGKPMVAWNKEPHSRTGAAAAVDEHKTPGTMVLVLVFLTAFAVYYFANWMWLSDVWEVR